MKASTPCITSISNPSSLPAFLGIGAQKAATKWLYAMLQQHPEVWMPPLKELHFFNRIGSADAAMRGRHRILARKHMASLCGDARRAEWQRYLDTATAPETISEEWYRDLFAWPANENVVKGEITPAYLELGAERIRYARELLGPAKIVLIIRRPLHRTLSQLRMRAARREDSESLCAQKVTEWRKIYRGMALDKPRGGYSNVTKWIDIFGADNVLAVPFGDVREAPSKLMTRIEDFLGVSRFGEYEKLKEKVHKSKKAEIPEEIVERIAEQVASEDAFLKSHFGEDFYARTK